jgi:hypothetical protein
MLRTELGSESDEVTGKWRYVHNAEFHNLYPSAINKTNRDALGEIRNTYRISGGNPERKKLQTSTREDNTNMNTV